MRTLPLLERDAVLLFDGVSVTGATIIRAKWDDQPARGGVVDGATLDPFHVVIVGVHKMHAADENSMLMKVSECFVVVGQQDRLDQFLELNGLRLILLFDDRI